MYANFDGNIFKAYKFHEPKCEMYKKRPSEKRVKKFSIAKIHLPK